jgi:fructose-1-phosphate kinase PfkB-like protein
MTVKEFKQFVADNKKVVVYCGYNTSPGTLEGDNCFRELMNILHDKYKYLACDVSGADLKIGTYLLGTSWNLPMTVLYADGVEIGRTAGSFNGDAKKYAEWIDGQFTKA